MKISRTELESYFAAPLPAVEQIADAFTFHSFEIDSIEGDVLDVKVLPNRAADCKEVAGLAGELSAILDLPLKQPFADATGTPFSITLARINGILGSAFSVVQVQDVFRRLGIPAKVTGDAFELTIPARRPDLTVPQDIAEEVGRIIGYENLAPQELPVSSEAPDQNRYRGIEKMKDALVAEGYIEVSTQSFAKKGDIYLANPLDKSKPALRTSLEENLQDALTRAKQYAPLVLPPNQKPKLFEVGSVFPKEGEYMELRMTERVPAWGDAAATVDNLSVAKLEDYGKDYEPKRYELGAFQPFSIYPFITRDIALWVPVATEGAAVEALIRENAGDLLARLDCFDRFEKEGKVSLAFRLVFQAMDRTLTDSEVQERMEAVTARALSEGYTVR